jgi:hypothetical protein
MYLPGSNGRPLVDAPDVVEFHFFRQLCVFPGGADISLTPPAIITSDEIWGFYKL